MRTIALAIAIAAIATSAFAEGRLPGNKNTNVNVATSGAKARSNSSVNIQDRRQAPGMGVGGGDCSIGGSISLAGFGGSAFGPASHCRIATNASTVATYVDAYSAKQYVCMQSQFKRLRGCAAR